MPTLIKQISNLEKVGTKTESDITEKKDYTLLQGQRLSYQIVLKPENICDRTRRIRIESQLADHIRIYCVKEVVVDNPSRDLITDEDYLLTEPGTLPDVLVPIEIQKDMVTLSKYNTVIWIKVDVPQDFTPGKYDIKVYFESANECDSCSMDVTVIPVKMPEQSLIYTRWFYTDCVADIHGAEIFSERYWKLIEEYISAATDVGINMILVPVHTPPLDTEIGARRPCVQLVDIEKTGDRYIFGFKKFKRFIDICKRSGIKYYEIAHLFSQWGSKCAPNIVVTENGETDYMFGWHVAADSEEYTSFLKQYIAAISEELKNEDIADKTYFHISDEPQPENIDRYETARNIIKPLIGNSKTFDALSHYEFYEKGLVECPVTSVTSVHEFLQHDIDELWVYYCCGPERVFTNSFISLPSYRTQIIGYQIYKYDIKGFLHWGFNFYNSGLSRYNINPYITTSSDCEFASGDGFIVYPGKETAYPSIRGEITFEAIQDINICRALEAVIGRKAVIDMIDEFAKRDLRFDDYPKGKDFLENLRAKMIFELAEYSKSKK